MHTFRRSIGRHLPTPPALAPILILLATAVPLWAQVTPVRSDDAAILAAARAQERMNLEIARMADAPSAAVPAVQPSAAAQSAVQLVPPPPPVPAKSRGGAATPQIGDASWYGTQFQGRRTADGEVYDMNKLTAAHKTLPFGTRVLVTDLANGKSVVVTINDRGPFVAGRIIDLSRAAAQRIGLTASGVARVRLQILGADGRVAPQRAPALAGNAAPPQPQAAAAPAATPMPAARAPVTGGTGAIKAGDGSRSPVPPPAPATAPANGTLIVQLGAFRDLGNAVHLNQLLVLGGFNPIFERAGDVTRVVLPSIPTANLPSVRQRLFALGVTSIFVRTQ